MQRKIITTIITLAFLLAITILPAAAQAAVQAELQVPDGQYTVGDPILLTLVVSHPADYQVIPPTLSDNLGDLVIYGQAPLQTVRNDDGTATTTQTIDTRLFAPGDYEIPAMVFSISDGAGNRDIKPQAELPYMNTLPLIIAATALGLIGAVGYLIWRRRQKQIALSQIDNRLPHEVVLDELNRVQGLRLPDRGRFKEHYTFISDAMRVYAERTFKVPVLERTTNEVQMSLKTTDVDADLASTFTDILDESDMVKFAKVTPDIDSAYMLIETSRQFVEATKPVPAAEDENENKGDVENPQMSKIHSTRIHPPTEVTP
jgi:hypothetical protein